MLSVIERRQLNHIASNANIGPAKSWGILEFTHTRPNAAASNSISIPSPKSRRKSWQLELRREYSRGVVKDW